MNVLVTGSAGFLAGPLVERLRARRGARLILTDRIPAPGRLVCDLRDSGACRRLVRRSRPGVVFHLAGTTRRDSWTQLWEAHVRTTVNLFEALLLLPRPQRIRVVVAGSSAEYGPAGSAAAREDRPPRPATVYGRAKLAQTLAALSFRHQGLQVAVVRIFNLLGPGMPEHLALGSFCRQIARSEAAGEDPARLRVGNLAPRRDYLDVRDAAAALAAIAGLPRPDGVFNVATGRSRSLRDLLRLLAAAAHCRVRAAVERSRLRDHDLPDLWGDTARIRRATGWRPVIPLERSLRDTLDWHRRHAAEAA